ncbi:response regulator [Flavobacterium ardleyense]|uniref:Response regulator n=1 Tax=Flavobacterium ardleyense TaxID=2038737 RepID=A0ABW5Z4E7_9FLAO
MINILLADDDIDDCLFFQDALEDLLIQNNLVTVSDGVQLMSYLEDHITNPPDVLFLDLNMPCKSGHECLLEIKCNDSLKEIPIVIFSTSQNADVVSTLYENGAHYYIRKPGDFNILKKVIGEALFLLEHNNMKQPDFLDFIILS